MFWSLGNNQTDPFHPYPDFYIVWLKNFCDFLKIKLNGLLSESFAKVTISYDGNYKTKESKRVRGYLSSVDEDIHFGLGKKNSIDSVEVLWNSGKSEVKYLNNINQTIVFNENDAKDIKDLNSIKAKVFEKTNIIDYNHNENYFNDFEKEILLPHQTSMFGPNIGAADLNGDGTEDIVVGGSSKFATSIYFQDENEFKKYLSFANYEIDWGDGSPSQTVNILRQVIIVILMRVVVFTQLLCQEWVLGGIMWLKKMLQYLLQI